MFCSLVAFGPGQIEPGRHIMDFRPLSGFIIGCGILCEEGRIDFEGGFGVIIDAGPMGVGAATATEHIKLVVQV